MMRQEWSEVKVLVLVDPQRDFTESGKLPVGGASDVLERCAGLLDSDQFDYRVATQDWHLPERDADHLAKWGDHCIAGTDGADLLFPESSLDAVFRKSAYSGACGRQVRPDNQVGSYLPDWLHDKRASEVTVVGVALDHCVKATAIDLASYGFDVKVVLFYTASVSPRGADDAIAEMEKIGVKVVDRMTGRGKCDCCHREIDPAALEDNHKMSCVYSRSFIEKVRLPLKGVGVHD